MVELSMASERKQRVIDMCAHARGFDRSEAREANEALTVAQSQNETLQAEVKRVNSSWRLCLTRTFYRPPMSVYVFLYGECLRAGTHYG